MNRRTFVSLPAAAAAATVPTKSKIKLGTQHIDDDAGLQVLAGLGVSHICSREPSFKYDAAWSVESLVKLRERVEKHGIKLDMVPLPLPSRHLSAHPYPDLMLGRSPGRERAVDEIQNIIRNISRAGIPAAKYNMSVLGVVRTEKGHGRGGAELSSFDYAKGKETPLRPDTDPFPADVYWERITWFLEQVIPVANEFKVKLACHPHDPAMPAGKGWRGVETVLSPEGLKRFISIKESPYHGLNFCQGTVTEGLKDPNKEIHHYIRYFGERKKIFNVHFRNIRGSFLKFEEVLPDEGDVNMIECIKSYKAVGYDGMLMPDHVPHIPGDPGGKQAFAFSFGYIRALIQMVES